MSKTSKTVSFLTLGCKVNQYESDGMAENLKRAGYSIVEFGEKADYTVINTCAVTNIASRKSRQMMSKAKKINKDTVLIACGCYIQSVEDVLNELPIVDIFLGNNQKNEIVSFISEYEENHQRQNHIIDINHTSAYENFAITMTEGHTRAYVKVQDGCNRFCTYCIIPYVRGRVRSRDIAEIVNEVTALAKAGYKEIVVTGIHVTSYGLDVEDPEINFSNLLVRLNSIEGIERIRMGSLEPNVITPEFVNTIKGLKKLCPHFHLSLQSGSNATLKRMNRHYTTEEYAYGVELLREAYDRPAITTDVIVGFPGETDEEFLETYKYLEELNLYEMHIFPYSKRKGTKAENFSDQIDGNTKHSRAERLRKMSAANKSTFEETFLMEELEVLIEEAVEINGERYFVGHTTRYVKNAIKADNLNPGNISRISAHKISHYLINRVRTLLIQRRINIS
ncbi:MAG: tRNA (N(6)-L-threonylcarbamoyladenosine(37)-C(2))-methylthiotransferase MtaB [Lachnospiraceae bacterium]|nr:tRNA (N(6)-L-threonylcarbamoyladenosine(37)-C(2))-methylthiotransferase MtaB [Lachnospiraceae bacterium]